MIDINKEIITKEELIDQLEQCKLKRDVDGLNVLANLLIEKSQKDKDLLNKAIGYYYVSLGRFFGGIYDEALILSKEALTICEKFKSSKYYILICNLVGVSYGTLTDYANSLTYFLKSYYASLEYEDSQNSYLALCNVGTLFFNMGFLDKAIEYYIKCIEARKLTFDNMEDVDGILITNLFGAYVKQHNYDKIKELEKWIKEYLNKYNNQVVYEDYNMYQIFIAYDENDFEQVEKLVINIIDDASRSADELHTFKNLIDILLVCLKMKNRKLCEELIVILKKIQEKYPEIKNEIKLNDLLIQKHILFNEKEELNVMLMNYYHSKKKEEMVSEEESKNHLLTNIELERVLYKQTLILKKNEELLKNNELDEFTMVYNKTAFQKYVKKDLKSVQKDCYQALILLDIDEFKMFNDSYGHSVGDEVLKSVANVLKDNIRNHEYVGRIGGDEFCIFMKDIYSQEYLEEKLNHIIKNLQDIEIDMLVDDIRASIGVCMIDSPTRYQQVFEIADQAMYQAKKQGKNQYCIKYIKNNR